MDSDFSRSDASSDSSSRGSTPDGAGSSSGTNDGGEDNGTFGGTRSSWQDEGNASDEPSGNGRPPRRVIVSSGDDESWQEQVASQRPEPKTYKDRTWLHLLLFLLTVASTVYVGGMFAGRIEVYEAQGYSYMLWDGIKYSFALLGALTVHEFGHYFAARHHRINTSLPYYIPLPVMPIGTLGAVIRIREPIPSDRKLFDIGAAGPLAGFVIAFAALMYGFVTLPPPEYLLDLGGHEALKEHIRQFGTFPSVMPESEGGEVIVLGETLLFWIVSQFFDHVPPMYEW